MRASERPTRKQSVRCLWGREWERFSILDQSARDKTERGKWLFVGWDGSETVLTLAEVNRAFGIAEAPGKRTGKRELVAFLSGAVDALPDDLAKQAARLLEAA